MRYGAGEDDEIGPLGLAGNTRNGVLQCPRRIGIRWTFDAQAPVRQRDEIEFELILVWADAVVIAPRAGRRLDASTTSPKSADS
jgi:hypothetical protein